MMKSCMYVSGPIVIHGLRQMGQNVRTGCRPSLDASTPASVSLASATTRAPASTAPVIPASCSSRSMAPATVVGSVTNTGNPACTSPRMSSLRFSSALATTRSGRNDSTRATSSALVPPTLVLAATASLGSTQKSLTPTTASPTPNTNSASVRLGTSETMRRGGDFTSSVLPSAST